MGFITHGSLLWSFRGERYGQESATGFPRNRPAAEGHFPAENPSHFAPGFFAFWACCPEISSWISFQERELSLAPGKSSHARLLPRQATGKETLMDWISLLPSSFTYGFIAGLAVGLFSKVALRFLAIAAVLVIAFELIRMAYLP